MANQEKKAYFIPVDHKLIPVSEEVWKIHSRQIANERSRARRDHKCGQPNYQKCQGDCGLCPWVLEGDRLLSIDHAFGTKESEDEIDAFENIPDTTAPLIDDIVADRDRLDALMRRLDQLVPDGGRIISMVMDEYSDRAMARALNLKSQSTLNYRKNKVKAYVRDHWKEFFEE